MSLAVLELVRQRIGVFRGLKRALLTYVFGTLVWLLMQGAQFTLFGLAVLAVCALGFLSGTYVALRGAANLDG